VYVKSNGNVDKAQANAATVTEVFGLVMDTAIASGVAGNVQMDGIVEATTTQWDAVTGGTGGLTPGAIYFLSAATAGRLTLAPPTTVGHYVARVGRAVSATKMDLAIEQPIKL
jgi:hypothetical protein